MLTCNISFADNLRVVDGDTIVLNGEKIRFTGIDTPELKQTCLKDDQELDCGMCKDAAGEKDWQQYT